MSYLCAYSRWGPGIDVIFLFLYLQSPQADTKLRLLHSTLMATHQDLLHLRNPETLQLNTSHHTDWKANLASPGMQPSPLVSSISVPQTPKAKRSPFQLISWWSLELKQALEWHPHLAVTSYPKIQPYLVSVCSPPHLSPNSRIASALLLDLTSDLPP